MILCVFVKKAKCHSFHTASTLPLQGAVVQRAHSSSIPSWPNYCRIRHNPSPSAFLDLVHFSSDFAQQQLSCTKRASRLHPLCGFLALLTIIHFTIVVLPLVVPKTVVHTKHNASKSVRLDITFHFRELANPKRPNPFRPQHLHAHSSSLQIYLQTLLQ